MNDKFIHEVRNRRWGNAAQLARFLAQKILKGGFVYET